MRKYEQEGHMEPVIALTDREPSQLYPEQLDKFSSESMHVSPMMEFDPAEAVARLRDSEGRRIMAIDIGGDTVEVGVATQIGDELVFDEAFSQVHRSTHGVGYLPVLEEASRYAQASGLPVGVDFAGPMDGSRPLGGANVGVFLQELEARHGSDFAYLFPTLASSPNDAVSGLVSGAIKAKLTYPEASNIILVINGSGLGGAVLTGQDNIIFSAEPGHVAVIPALNIENQQTPCGQFDNDFVCVERVAAGKAGIEDIWFRLTGERLTGREIEKQYLQGSRQAGNLYEDSAVLTAHVVQGMANSFSFDLRSPATVVVGHGGSFKFPNYGLRIQQTLNYALRAEPRLLMTKDYTPNACLEGAGQLALLNSSR